MVDYIPQFHTQTSMWKSNVGAGEVVKLAKSLQQKQKDLSLIFRSHINAVQAGQAVVVHIFNPSTQ